MNTSQVLHGGRLSEAAREFGLPGESFSDFSSNLNVLAPQISPEVWSQWLMRVTRYPEIASATLGQQLARLYQTKWILPTAGATEALYLAARLFAGQQIAVIEPSFGDYSRSFQAQPCTVERIVLDRAWWYAPARDWAHLLEPFDVVMLGNPNNPTGALQSRKELAGLFQREWSRPKTWIVDEAFIEFASADGLQTVLPLVPEFPGLIVLRSLTKTWCIPGLRIGFLATSGPLEQLRRMQPPWSLNAVVQGWAECFLTQEHHNQLLAAISQLDQLKRQFKARLDLIPGIHVYPSAANFLLIELTDPLLDAWTIYRQLGNRGLLIRVCDSFYGIPKGRFMRVAVRTGTENLRLAEQLSDVCAQLIRRAA